MKKLLEIKNLKKQFQDNIILNNINLEIEKKDIFGILGLSGAGKSTLVRCICGLEKIDGGEIIFSGKNQEKAASADHARGRVWIPSGGSKEDADQEGQDQGPAG